ncbi:MAG: CobW family GTP-binding protein [Thiohalorhabdus sp.]|uniref:CobW family GTP-binding protein n=1 Tax=Thiohalorhabdus sp. TaxID=3094134 RepID=UPI003980BA52
MPEPSPLPCHVIAGPLGVGKTTATLDYLRRHAGEQEVGVVVNDFGPVGLDGAILEGEGGEGGPEVATVPGGCVCCAAAEGLVTTLQRMLELPGLDRLIIEPSGMADPAQVLGLLRQMAGQSRLELRPTIALLNAAEFEPHRASQMPFFRHMADAADILVLNRCDAAEPGTEAAFREWAAGLQPPKLRVVTTEHGHLDEELFALRLPEPAGTEDHAHGHTHAVEEAAEDPSGGATWPAARCFQHDRLTAVLEGLAREGMEDTRVERLKGVFRTERGWWVLQIANGEVKRRETPARKDSRADWIATEGRPETVRALLEGALRTE